MNSPILKLCSLLVACHLITSTIIAQCPSSINVSTQQQLETLMSQYPNCENITGHVTISGEVEDLSVLGQIQSIGGNLTIQQNTALNSLAGLGSLTSVGNALKIEQNSALAALDGLGQLSSVSGWMTIRDCPGLVSIQGLSALTVVGGRFFLTGLDALQSLAGLNSLTSVGESFHLVGMPVLQSLDGLQNLRTVTKDLFIGGSDAFGFSDYTAPELMSVSGLSGLEQVGGGFEIHNCLKLEVIDGINALTTAGGLVIVDNPVLTKVSGFEALASLVGAVNFNGIYITDNPLLTQIDGTKSLRTTLFFRIEGEAVDSIALDNLEEVEQRFDIEAFSMTKFSGPDKLAIVGGDFIISTGQQELSGFPMLESVGGMFLIDSRDYLEVVSGFNGLHSIGIGQLGWGFDIYEHDKLTTISGFNSLETVEGDFVLANNDLIVDVSGFQSLASVGGLFSVSSNTALNDCTPFCTFLEEGTVGEEVYIAFNGTNIGGCWTEEIVRDRCEYKLLIVDANPEFFPAELEDFNTVSELSYEQIRTLMTLREAVTADSVSQVLLKMEVPVEGNIESATPVDAVSFPWGTITFEEDERYYCYALYYPPPVFNASDGATFKYKNDVLGTKQTVTVDFVDMESEHKLVDFSVTIVRPPVILVHGTYSSPDKWKEKIDGGKSMHDALTEADYKTFLLDYTAQNGSDNSVECDFSDIVNVLQENPGGINEALEYYRSTLNAATTQVDVIGHSLGGIIPRIYASEHFNPDGYTRRDNFMKGDLNRIISIGGTHFGSHLAEFQSYLENGFSAFDVGLLEWIQAATLTYFTASWLGAPLSEAVRDQLPAPMGTALEMLGATPVPAHAIAMSIPPGELLNPEYDPVEEYYDMFWYITLLMEMNSDITEQYLNYKISLKEMGLQAATTLQGGDPHVLFKAYNDLQLFKSMIKDGIKATGLVLSVLDGTFLIASKAEILKWTLAETGMSDIVNVDPLIDIFVAGADPTGVVANYFVSRLTPSPGGIVDKYLRVNDKSMEAVRALIFNNDANDGVVRVQSQTGELEKDCEDCVSRFEHHLHGPALLYPDIQARVVSLLDGGMTDFRMEGFSGPDHGQLLYYPSDTIDLYTIRRTGPAAICQSGMVPEHAKAFARIANEQRVVIVVRPVNPDASKLIYRGAATKVMDVKPKSSNWGPQKGYLPVQQRYSKLWKAFEGDSRDEKIAQYNEKAQENLMNGVTLERHLQIQTCDNRYWVYVDSSQLLEIGDLNAENEIVLVPADDPTQVCYWEEPFTTDMIVTDCATREPNDRFGPLTVMASPDNYETDGVSHRYITADYDLLMIGFYKGEDNNPHDPPQDVPFREGVGQMTAQQEALLSKLNAAVIATGYDGGNVVHHGPENQFRWSPYIDYPLTAFVPNDVQNGFFFGGNNGQILSIDMGDPGFRDINLKHFVNKWRQKGYDLYTNVQAPGWQWTWDEEREAYWLEDSKDLPSYVEQLPHNYCDKFGYPAGVICPPVIGPAKPTMSPDKIGWLGRSPGTVYHWTIHPNPVTSGNLTLNVDCIEQCIIEFRIADALGVPRYTGQYALMPGENTFDIPTDDLEPGMYSIQSDVLGAIRFIRL